MAEISTPRGIYRLTAAAPLEDDIDAKLVTLTLAMERADGVERILIKCRIARPLLGSAAPEAHALIERLRPWLEHDFEHTREAALKSIRTERRLHQVWFDDSNPGPFHH